MVTTATAGTNVHHDEWGSGSAGFTTAAVSDGVCGLPGAALEAERV